MDFVKQLSKEIRGMCPYSKKLIAFSFWCAVLLFFLGCLSFFMSFRLDYHEQMLIHRAAMEAAPTTFVSGFIAALLCDLAHRTYFKKD